MESCDLFSKTHTKNPVGPSQSEMGFVVGGLGLGFGGLDETAMLNLGATSGYELAR